MAFTTPPTFSAGVGGLTAAMLNTYVRDNFKALGDAWTSYTPTLGGWTLGNGTLVGKWMSANKLVMGRIEYTVGSTDTKSGTLTFATPVTPNLINGATCGRAGLFDTSAANRAFRHVFWGSAANAFFATSEADVRITPTTPWTWATGDQVFIDFEYEAA